MVFNKGEEKGCNIGLNGKMLEQVEEFKYLGSIIQSNGKIDKEIQNRVCNTNKVIGAFSNFARNINIEKNAKLKVFNAIVTPSLTYASETWAWQRKDMSKVQATEMKFLRAMEGVRRIDKIRNSVIRDKCNVKESIIEKIQNNRLRWYGHIMRMEDSKLTKTIFQGEVEGRRKQGRPQHRWMDTVRRDIAEKGLELEEAEMLVNNRKEWRKIVRKKV